MNLLKNIKSLLDKQCGDLSEIPLKQRAAAPKSLLQYEREASSKHEAIVKAYQSGGYTQKQIGNYFGLHYSQISRIFAKCKT